MTSGRPVRHLRRNCLDEELCWNAAGELAAATRGKCPSSRSSIGNSCNLATQALEEVRP